jgi:hydrogenase expression/formation protein HypC
MCLAVPGKLVRWISREPIFASAELEFDGVRRVCHMACVADADIGDYVIVHAGVAISKVDAAEAARLLDDLARLGSLADEARREFMP